MLHRLVTYEQSSVVWLQIIWLIVQRLDEAQLSNDKRQTISNFGNGVQSTVILFLEQALEMLKVFCWVISQQNIFKPWYLFILWQLIKLYTCNYEMGGKHLRLEIEIKLFVCLIVWILWQQKLMISAFTFLLLFPLYFLCFMMGEFVQTSGPFISGDYFQNSHYLLVWFNCCVVRRLKTGHS